MSDKGLLQCFNRGCGSKYNPGENQQNSCRHHPGEPFFHDAYKGWSCCNKKCTDFTEFLNIKGCTLSKHSNTKPPEPEKPPKDEFEAEVVEVKPIVRECLVRPPLDTPVVTLKPEVTPTVLKQLNTTAETQSEHILATDDEVAIGTLCKNGGCNKSYEGLHSNQTPCEHHPGVPVFHEGLKYWSCCTKRTSDFNTFLSQVGCQTGNHLWIKKDVDAQSMNCRWDFHQTGSHIIVSIYAKQYCPVKTTIQLNPIRLVVEVVFPQQGNAKFAMDYELYGVVDVSKSGVTFYGTKIEIKLKKAQVGNWNQLEIIKSPIKKPEVKKTEENLVSQVKQVDLTDL